MEPVLLDGNGRNPDGTVKKGFVLNPNGRPPKKKIEDYIGEDEKEELVQLFISQCREKPELMRLLIEQLFGKAKQSVEMGNPEGKAFNITFDKTFKDYGSSSSGTAGDSK